MATASGPNVLPFLLLILADVHHFLQWELHFSISLLPWYFSFLPWKLPYNIKLLFTCSFFSLLVGKMSLSSIFRLITSPISIKLNDFYCLWDFQPHSFPPSHQFSSFLIPLASPSVSKHPQIFHMPCINSFKPCLSLFSLLPSHFYQAIFSLYLFPQYILPSILATVQTAESIQHLEWREFDKIIFT